MPERSACICVILPYANVLTKPFAFVEVLAVPKNMKLLAIPLFELYDNAGRSVPTFFDAECGT